VPPSDGNGKRIPGWFVGILLSIVTALLASLMGLVVHWSTVQDRRISKLETDHDHDREYFMREHHETRLEMVRLGAKLEVTQELMRQGQTQGRKGG